MLIIRIFSFRITQRSTRMLKRGKRLMQWPEWWQQLCQKEEEDTTTTTAVPTTVVEAIIRAVAVRKEITATTTPITAGLGSRANVIVATLQGIKPSSVKGQRSHRRLTLWCQNTLAISCLSLYSHPTRVIRVYRTQITFVSRNLKSILHHKNYRWTYLRIRNFKNIFKT